MLIQLVHEDIVGDVAGSGPEVAPRPEPLASSACGCARTPSVVAARVARGFGIKVRVIECGLL